MPLDLPAQGHERPRPTITPSRRTTPYGRLSARSGLVNIAVGDHRMRRPAHRWHRAPVASPLKPLPPGAAAAGSGLAPSVSRARPKPSGSALCRHQPSRDLTVTGIPHRPLTAATSLASPDRAAGPPAPPLRADHLAHRQPMLDVSARHRTASARRAASAIAADVDQRFAHRDRHGFATISLYIFFASHGPSATRLVANHLREQAGLRANAVPERKDPSRSHPPARLDNHRNRAAGYAPPAKRNDGVSMAPTAAASIAPIPDTFPLSADLLPDPHDSFQRSASFVSTAGYRP